MRRVFLAAGLLVALALGRPAFGQSTNATIGGTIEDVSGAVIPGATVTATNSATGVATTVLSNEAGRTAFQACCPACTK